MRQALRTTMGVGSLLVALVLGLLPHPAEATPTASVQPDRSMRDMHRDCSQLPWCTPSYWAWQLQLSVHRRDRSEALAVAAHLLDLQQRDGRWGLGTPWGRMPIDFKERTAGDAESWEVAEVGLALLTLDDAFDVPAARVAARRASRYLVAKVDRVKGAPYLAHMPDCNNLLQPHSTIAAAALLDRFPRHRTLADRLRRSGKAMQWRRLEPLPGRTDLRQVRWGLAINDYERIQVGHYLTLLGDRSGQRILRTYRPATRTDSYRAQPYLVMLDVLAGRSARAKTRARMIGDFTPVRAFDSALENWLTLAR